MNNLLWELIQQTAKSIGMCAELVHMPPPGDASPEAKALSAALEKVLAAQRDHLQTMEYLYAQLTREKPATEVLEYAKTALSDFREQAKIIK